MDEGLAPCPGRRLVIYPVPTLARRLPSPYYLTPQHVCANMFLAKNRPGGASRAPPIEREKAVRRQLKEQDNQPSRDPAHRPTRPLGQVSTQAVLTFRQLAPSFLRARQGILLCAILKMLFLV